MRTGRSLTVFRSLQPGGSVPGPGGCTWSWGGVPGPRGVYLILGGVYLVPGEGGVPGPGGCTWSRGGGVPGPGGVYLVRYSPPVNRMTNRCKNITLAKTSFRPVIKILQVEHG